MALPLQLFGSRKPLAGAQIDFSHDLAKGLAFACVFNEEGSSLVNNLVGGHTGLLSGTTKPTWATGRPGGLQFNGLAATPAQSYVEFSTDRLTQDLSLTSDGSGPMTILARVWQTASANCGIAERNNGNVSKGWALGIVGLRPQFTVVRSVSNISLTANNGLTAGKWQTVALVWNGLLSPTTAPLPVIYINALDAGRNVFNGGSGSGVSDSTESFRVGRASIVSSGSFAGYIDYVYVWRRMLSQGEIQALEVTPYAFFDDPFSIEKIVGGAAAPDAGTGALTVKHPVLSGSGAVINTGTGSFHAKHPTLSGTGTVSNPAVRLSQSAVEDAEVPATTPVRLSQAPVEDLEQFDLPLSRLSQMSVEDLEQYDRPQVRLSQMVVEIMFPFSCDLTPPVPPKPAIGCASDLPLPPSTGGSGCVTDVPQSTITTGEC